MTTEGLISHQTSFFLSLGESFLFAVSVTCLSNDRALAVILEASHSFCWMRRGKLLVAFFVAYVACCNGLVGWKPVSALTTITWFSWVNREQHDFVSKRTESLHTACEQLLSDQVWTRPIISGSKCHVPCSSRLLSNTCLNTDHLFPSFPDAIGAICRQHQRASATLP